MKLENVTLSMWVAANWRIKHELATTGKLSGTSIFSDYSSYKVKLNELLRAILQESEAKLEMKIFNPPSIFVWR